MKLLVLLVAVLLLVGCAPFQSGNTASDDDTRIWSKDRTSDTDILSENDVRLVDIKVDSRDFSTTEISTCPLATEVGTGSCNAVTP